MNVTALVRATSAFVSTLAHRAPPKPTPRPVVSPGVVLSAAPQPGVENKCPVCQARFRGARVCSRCGADLEPLMRLTVKAWQLREAARQAIVLGDFGRALQLANEAQVIQHTDSGTALKLVAAWVGSRNAILLSNPPSQRP